MAYLLFGVLASLTAAPPQPQFQLSNLFSDHMVIQRNRPVLIYGKDAPGTQVQIKLDQNLITTTVGADGKFSVALPKLPAGGPHTLTVKGTGTRTVKDILVGEVWVCSGQSNMEWVVANSKFLNEELAECDTNIRMFTVTKAAVMEPAANVDGTWAVSTPQSSVNFSAVGFAFAKRLYKELGVPIGMIHTSWGGTPAEAWTTRTTLANDPMTKPIFDRTVATEAEYPAKMAAYKKALRDWQDRTLTQWSTRTAEARQWESPEFDDRTWESQMVPGTWDPNFDGVGWYRKTVYLTAEEAKAARLDLGPIDDLDQTFVNGVQVGFTDLQTQNHWQARRSYPLPAGLLKAGKNVIAVRVVDTGGAGGIYGVESDLMLGSYRLAGQWKFKIEAPLIAPPNGAQGGRPEAPMGPNNPNYPGSLMNGMLSPLVPYPIKGAIWYQGESNAGRSEQYKTLFPMMISDWRRLWNQGDFPFYWVQLANFMRANPAQFESGWAELRQAQKETQKLKNTGMAVIIDIGEADDIHPRNKRDVGHRLARLALAKDYGIKIETSGPEYRTIRFARDGSGTVSFTHAKGLKTADGQAPRCFAIRAKTPAGGSTSWVWADAQIVGETVKLSHPSIKGPFDVRYAWQDNPPVNLVNAEGLPAGPFRTDNSPFITANNR